MLRLSAVGRHLVVMQGRVPSRTRLLVRVLAPSRPSSHDDQSERRERAESLPWPRRTRAHLVAAVEAEGPFSILGRGVCIIARIFTQNLVRSVIA